MAVWKYRLYIFLFLKDIAQRVADVLKSRTKFANTLCCFYFFLQYLTTVVRGRMWIARALLIKKISNTLPF